MPARSMTVPRSNDDRLDDLFRRRPLNPTSNHPAYDLSSRPRRDRASSILSVAVLEVNHGDTEGTEDAQRGSNLRASSASPCLRWLTARRFIHKNGLTPTRRGRRRPQGDVPHQNPPRPCHARTPRAQLRPRPAPAREWANPKGEVYESPQAFYRRGIRGPAVGLTDEADEGERAVGPDRGPRELR